MTFQTNNKIMPKKMKSTKSKSMMNKSMKPKRPAKMKGNKGNMKSQRGY